MVIFWGSRENSNRYVYFLGKFCKTWATFYFNIQSNLLQPPTIPHITIMLKSELKTFELLSCAVQNVRIKRPSFQFAWNKNLHSTHSGKVESQREWVFEKTLSSDLSWTSVVLAQTTQPVWPVKSRQMSIKVVQKGFC